MNITAEQDGIQAETGVLISAGEVNVTAGGGSANGEQKTGNAMFGGAQNTTADETLSTKGIKAEAALDITGGTVTVDGKELSAMRDEELTIFRRRNIGFIFQSFQLIPELNVEQNIAFPLLLDYRKPKKSEVDELLELLGLTERRRHLPSQLSGGQQQRVAIGRALITKPKLILADEPTGNLDTKNSQDVIALLTQASRHYQQTILMITHNSNLTASVDRVFRVSDGVLTDLGGMTNEKLS